MMSRPLGILTMLIGAFCGQVLLVGGLSLLFGETGLTTERYAASVALLGAGLLVAMWLVIDRLVPDATVIVVVPLKLAAFLAFALGGSITVYTIVSGQPII